MRDYVIYSLISRLMFSHIFLFFSDTFSLHRQRRAGFLNLCCKNGTILPTVWLPTKTGPPKVTKISGSSQIVVRDDSYVKFQCKVVSNLAANVTWLLNGLPLTGQMKHNHFVVGWNADSGILAKSEWYHSPHPQHLP